MKRIIAGATSAALLGITPLALVAPAHAATETHSVTIAATPSYTAVEYGDDLTVSVQATSTDGRSYPPGLTTLYALPAGASEWVAVAQDDNAGSSFYDVKPTMNTTYKVVYAGYTATSTSEDNYTAAESAPFTVGVQRLVEIGKGKGNLMIKGKVKPNYGKKKVKILRKKGKRWVKHAKVKTNAKGVFNFRLPRARRGTKVFYKIVIPASSQYLGYAEVWYSTTYRAPNARSVS